MGNQLTNAQRHSDDCPDCGNDPAEPDSHRVTCRRLGMDTQAPPDVIKLELQCGPPWNDWPDDVKPVNPLAKA